jgi:hypothetical protein
VTPGTKDMPSVPEKILVGLRLGEMRQDMGRLPSVVELQQKFRCSRATAYRYQAALRGGRAA